MAQRRVRKCMEAVIPRDVIDDALEECHKTLKAKCELTPQRITGMAAKFASEYSITKEQIEKKIQRRLEAITQAQFLEMMRIYNSLRDGMSKPGEWFEVEEEAAPETTTDAIKAKLQKSAPPESQSSPSLFDSAVAAVEQSTDPISCKAAFDGWIPKLSEPDQADLNTAYQQKLATFPTSKKKNQGGLPLNP
jgi:hypothetical protein